MGGVPGCLGMFWKSDSSGMPLSNAVAGVEWWVSRRKGESRVVIARLRRVIVFVTGLWLWLFGGGSFLLDGDIAFNGKVRNVVVVVLIVVVVVVGGVVSAVETRIAPTRLLLWLSDDPKQRNRRLIDDANPLILLYRLL